MSYSGEQNAVLRHDRNIRAVDVRDGAQSCFFSFGRWNIGDPNRLGRAPPIGPNRIPRLDFDVAHTDVGDISVSVALLETDSARRVEDLQEGEARLNHCIVNFEILAELF